MNSLQQQTKEWNDLRIKSIIDRTITIHVPLARAIEVIIYTSYDKKGQQNHVIACARVRLFLYGVLSSHVITKREIKIIFKRMISDSKAQTVISILSKELF